VRTIAHVSDVHLGAHLPAAVEALVEDVAAAAPDLTVVTGDLTMRARPGQFRQAVDLLNRLPAPRLVVPGNHDIPLDNPVLRLLAPYRRYRRFLPAGPDWPEWVDLPGLRVVGLDSTAPWRWKSGWLGARQRARLVALLGSARPGAVRAVALHHPVAARGLGGIADRRRLLDALFRAGANLVLAGHTHVPAFHPVPAGRPGPGHSGPGDGGPDGSAVLEVVAGTAVSTREWGTGQSWTLVRVAPGAVTVQHRYPMAVTRPG
jgi:3',5'-cyclic AMP phosphodiesterase CpdA